MKEEEYSCWAECESIWENYRINASRKIFQILSEQLEFETLKNFPDLKMCV